MPAALTSFQRPRFFGDLEILKGVNIEVPFGEVHALMGPNGSGKSTLCHVLMGKDEYRSSGSALVGGTEVIGLPVDERARVGLFEAFQYPVEVPGVTLDDLIQEMGEVRNDADFSERVETRRRDTRHGTVPGTVRQRRPLRR